jgi:hypothetical protein
METSRDPNGPADGTLPRRPTVRADLCSYDKGMIGNLG